MKLLQPRAGYRSSLDPVLLAGFHRAALRAIPRHRLRHGRAFLSAAGARRGGDRRGRRDPAAPGRAGGRSVASRTACERRWSVSVGDVREGGVPSTAAASTWWRPIRPFVRWAPACCRRTTEKALAHHEVTLDAWRNGWTWRRGRCGRVGGSRPSIPSTAGRSCGPVWRSEVSSSRVCAWCCHVLEATPGRVLVEARLGQADAREEPPLVVHDDGGYTPEVRAMLGEDA